MKKKVLSIALVVAMIAIIAAGSLAYFTDTDSEDNVFTSGKVDISVDENFTPNSKLLPATGSAQNGTLKNGVTKEVWVQVEDGSEDTYVRVHIAIPQILDNGSDTFDASQNVLHFNYGKDTVGAGLWDWSNATGAPYEGQWNYYEQEIDGVMYNVYVVTYESVLEAGDVTPNAMNQVYLDSKVTNADVEKINAALGDDWEIKVVAEGCQADGFDNAYDALNTAFGVPGSYNPWAA